MSFNEFELILYALVRGIFQAFSKAQLTAERFTPFVT